MNLFGLVCFSLLPAHSISLSGARPIYLHINVYGISLIFSYILTHNTWEAKTNSSLIPVSQSSGASNHRRLACKDIKIVLYSVNKIEVHSLTMVVMFLHKWQYIIISTIGWK